VCRNSRFRLDKYRYAPRRLFGRTRGRLPMRDYVSARETQQLQQSHNRANRECVVIAAIPGLLVNATDYTAIVAIGDSPHSLESRFCEGEKNGEREIERELLSILIWRKSRIIVIILFILTCVSLFFFSLSHNIVRF